jgi:hypothetical protein
VGVQLNHNDIPIVLYDNITRIFLHDDINDTDHIYLLSFNKHYPSTHNNNYIEYTFPFHYNSCY